MSARRFASIAALMMLVAAAGCTAGGTSTKKDGGAGSGGSSGSGGGGSGGGAGGASGGSGGAKDGGGGAAGKEGGISMDSGGGSTCLAVQMCANGCMDMMCVADCVAMGSSAAQDLYNKLDMCLMTDCGSMCGMGGDMMACHMCYCDSQCTPSGMCKKANEDCVMMTPDPDCMTSC